MVKEKRKLLFLACILLLNLLCCNANTDQSDVSALNVLFQSFNSPSQLQGWTANGGDPCGQSWRGITCSGSKVTSIKLNGLGLTGNLGYNMNSMNSLTELDLSNNNIGGGAIPYNLPPNLQTLNLAQNQFNGQLPYSISLMTSLKTLNVAHNGLQGNLTDMFSSMGSLTTLDLSFNGLTGDLPESFSSLSSLNTLYLQNNQFTGSINPLATLPLKTLNVANNRFTGWIPDSVKKINSLTTDGNSWNSGPAPPPPPFTPPPSGRKSNPGRSPSGGSQSNNNSSSGSKSGISGGVIAGIVIVFLVVGVIVGFFVIKKKRNKSKAEHFEQHQPFRSSEIKDPKPIAPAMQYQPSPPHRIEVTELVPPVPLSLKPPPKTDDFANKPVVSKKSSLPTIKSTVYSVADLQMATESFSVDSLIGEGSFGKVYRAQFNDGKVLAVKKLSSQILPHSASDEFAALVSKISKLKHANLAELAGYCMEHGQHLLLYQFYTTGSLHDLLHLDEEGTKPLSWNSRVKIALGSARALEYLHEVCSPSIVHKNFKSSNILLDSEINPHVSDAGLASLLSDDQFQALDQGTGYNAPEVAMSGQYNLKSDVYSFGVVMLELLTGRKPFDSSRARSEQSLVRWAAPQLHDIDALDRMVDPTLKGLYPAKSLSRFADVIALCVQPEPEFRPPMSEVVQALVRLVQRANMTKRMLDGEGQESSRRLDDNDMNEFI
ncbi:hypothetical protein LUZ60_005675 [Juncus effusus]|nr:hypothetical protein LUZ60_005675 [Juncus effusus]